MSSGVNSGYGNDQVFDIALLGDDLLEVEDALGILIRGLVDGDAGLPFDFYLGWRKPVSSFERRQNDLTHFASGHLQSRGQLGFENRVQLIVKQAVFSLAVLDKTKPKTIFALVNVLVTESEGD